MITKQPLNIKRYPLLTSLALLFILVTTFCVYSPALKAQFTNWDDDEHVVSNTHIRSLDTEHIKQMFESRMAKTFIPLTLISYSIEYHFFGLNPRVYHLTNIILHLMVVALSFYFFVSLGMSRLIALSASFLFAIHPMHVESVAWVSERKDVLCALFYLSALLCYWYYLSVNSRRWIWYGASLFLGVLSILSKPMAFSLPLILLLMDWWKKRPLHFSMILDKLPHIIYVSIFSWLTFSLNVTNKTYSFYETSLIWIWSFTFYIKKFFIPSNYSAIYKIPEPISLLQMDYFTACLILILVIAGVWLYRKNRIFLFAFVFYLFGVSILIIRTGWKFGNLTVVADRFMYLPSLGICMFLAWAFCDLIEKSKHKLLLVTTIIILSCLLLFQSWRQVRVWTDNISLWSHTIKMDPSISRAYINRAQGYIEQKRFDEANRDLDSALLADAEGQRNARLYMLRGLIAYEKNDLNSALAAFNSALEIKPIDATTLINRGNIYALMKRYDLATADFNKALDINLFSPRAYFGLGNMCVQQGKYVEGLGYYEKTLDLDPHFEKARLKRAMIEKILRI
jgi:cytochrome c-type biogenesis protein CcmH/NrfG